MLRPLTPLVALLLALAACGDGDPDTALHLRLVPSPQTTEAQLLSQLDTVEIVLDAVGGFSNLPSGASQVGAFSAADVDGDGVTELIWSRSLGSSLPDLWLTPGKNGDKLLEVAAYGRAKGQILVTAKASKIGFTPGTIREVDLSLTPVTPPKPTTCASLNCGAKQVCSEETGTPTCVDDCRVYGCKTGYECDAQGFCQPCPGGSCAPPKDCKTQCASACSGKDPDGCALCIKKCEAAS
jgi:hypothetical protein